MNLEMKLLAAILLLVILFVCPDMRVSLELFPVTTFVTETTNSLFLSSGFYHFPFQLFSGGRAALRESSFKKEAKSILVQPEKGASSEGK